MMCRFRAVSEETREAINWIFHAVRPLSTSELTVAVALGSYLGEGSAARSTFPGFVDKVSWDIMSDLGAVLGAFVKVDDDRVFLRHHTFHDYLQNNGTLLLPDFHATVSSRCLSYLTLHFEFSAGSTDDSETDEADWGPATVLVDYAALYWPEHHKLQITPAAGSEDEVFKFVTDWGRAMKLGIPRRAWAYDWKDGSADDPLSFSAQAGFYQLVDRILKDKAPVSSARMEGAMRAAAQEGRVDILERLLREVGPVANAMPALRATAANGHEDAIVILLAHLRNTSPESLATNGGADDPVFLAATRGHAAAVKTLLSEEQGFGLLAVDSMGNTAVHLASRLGDIDTLRILYEFRTDDFKRAVSLASGDGTDNRPFTPLQLTCFAGGVDAFDYVREHSPEEHVIKSENNLTRPLALAASSGSLAIVDRLIRAGVDPFTGSFEDTAIAVLPGAAVMKWCAGCTMKWRDLRSHTIQRGRGKHRISGQRAQKRPESKERTDCRGSSITVCITLPFAGTRASLGTSSQSRSPILRRPRSTCRKR